MNKKMTRIMAMILAALMLFSVAAMIFTALGGM